MMISFRSHVCAIADRSVSASHFSALYAGMRIDTKGFMLDASLAILHTHSESARPQRPTNDGRWHNLVSPAVALPNFCTDHSRNKFRSSWPSPPDPQACKEIPSCLRRFLP